ncbi:hypothetical protein CBS101457_002011 [Exobasidium rhododendri]|nr:hypothetical protein CBS101457_002011 [Exobasidium rhododendri]
MVRLQEEMNHFAVMGLSPSATEAEIKKAYRKLSLALHPDKNLNEDPEVASAKFHEMQLAYEILMDPSARLAAAERNKAEVARKERRGAYDGKRKEMAEELERKEEEERAKRFKGIHDEKKRSATLEKLREEGRKLREEKEKKRALEAEKQATRGQNEKSQRVNDMHHSSSISVPEPLLQGQPDLGPLDLTVRLRFPSDQLALLTTSTTASSSGDSALNTPLAQGLEVRFGKLDSLIWKSPKVGKKKSREVTAHATFKTLDSAFAAVKRGSQLRAGGPGLAHVLEDVWIGWAAGSRSVDSSQDAARNGEPTRVTWLRDHGRLSTEVASASDDDESLTSSGRPYSPPEHDILSRMKNRTDTNQSSTDRTSSLKLFPSFSFSTSSIEQGLESGKTKGNLEKADFESSTLQKMREAERRRMEEAIRQVEEQSI